MDREAVDVLRATVKVWDWTESSAEEVYQRIANLDSGAVVREIRDFPPLETPDRAQLPSRGSVYPIYAETVAEAWLQVLNAVVSCGETKGTRKGDRLKEVLNTVAVIEPRFLPTDPVVASDIFDFGPDNFEAYWRDFMARQKPPGQDYSYGERMQNWPLSSDEKGGKHQKKRPPLNQLAQVSERLRRSPDTKRGTIVFLGPTDMEELDDAPCLSMATFNRWGGRLFGTFVIRSNDMYGAWPHNALSLRRLQKDMAHELGVEPGATTIISHSAHIYERHWEQAYAKVDEWLDSGKIMKWYRELGWDGPAGGLRPDPAGNFEFAQSPEGVRIRLMSQEADEVLREASGANPRPLLRAMLYRMPWVEPLHAEYLGEQVEAALAARAKGDDYHQR